MTGLEEAIEEDWLMENKKTRKARRTHKVSDEASAWFDNFIDEHIDEKYIAQNTRAHNKAYGTVLKDYEGHNISTEEDLVDKLADSLIQYRNEVQHPVRSKEKGGKFEYDKDQVKDEVRSYLSRIKQDEKSQIDINDLIAKGDTGNLLKMLHESEKQRHISSKIKEDLYKMVEEEQEPDYYIDRLKALENATGRRSRKNDLVLRATRDSLINEMLSHYNTVVHEKLVDKKAEYTQRHYDAANNNEHFAHERKTGTHG